MARWREAVVKSSAYLTALIDFGEDERVDEGVVRQAKEWLVPVREAMRREVKLSSSRALEIVRSGFEVALVGAPNTGKSSLLNALARREVAIVSATAGTTRDTVHASVDLEGFKVNVTDTAGVRETEDAVERMGIERAQRAALGADATVLVVDLPRVLADADALLPAEMVSKAALVVLSQCDRGGPSEVTRATAVLGARLPGVPVIATSTATGVGLPDLIKELGKRARDAVRGGAKAAGEEQALLFRARHRDCVARTLAHLDAFESAPDTVIAAEELRCAALTLGELTGTIANDEILDVLFASFCIGK